MLHSFRRRRGAEFRLQTRALLAAMTTPPNRTRTFLIDDTIGALIAAGVWGKLDALWVMAAHDSQAGLLNWKNPSTFTLINFNSTTFTQNVGFTGNATDMYLGTGSAWTSFSQFSQDSGTLFTWVTGGTDAAVNRFSMGHGSNTLGVRLTPRSAGGQYAAVVNSASETAGGTSSTIVGLTHANRSASNAVQIYRNGASVATGAEVSKAVLGSAVTILRGGTVYADFEVAVSGAGSSLTAGEASSLYTALNAYMGAL